MDRRSVRYDEAHRGIRIIPSPPKRNGVAHGDQRESQGSGHNHADARRRTPPTQICLGAPGGTLCPTAWCEPILGLSVGERPPDPGLRRSQTCRDRADALAEAALSASTPPRADIPLLHPKRLSWALSALPGYRGAWRARSRAPVLAALAIVMRHRGCIEPSRQKTTRADATAVAKAEGASAAFVVHPLRDTGNATGENTRTPPLSDN